MEGYPRRFGSYTLLKPLARGGMGALYLAVSGDRGMEKLCVVKTALPHLHGKGYLQRFRDEAKVVVRLSHGNLVAVFDAGQVEGEIYLAMDYVEGKDLRAVWNRCASKGIAFPIDVAAHIVKELVRGLDFAHTFERLALVHRDVSPPNVLLSYAGEVKLTDFGLATSTLKLEKTAPGVIYGKVSYMAPEQARGETLDGRADVYAAGIILWEILTGRQLFPPGTARGVAAGGADTDDELLERVRQPQVPPPSSRTTRVPAELDRIVLKALSVDTKGRYQSGEEFRQDLAAFLAKTAPGTDSAQVSKFLRQLFGDDIDRERAERSLLLAESARMGTASAVKAVPAGEERPTGRARPAADPTPAPGSTDVAAKPPSEDKTRALDHHPDEISRVVGTILGGRYLVRRMCGEGGMGRVYEAEHVEIGKRVAIKVLHPAYTRTPDVVERFRREARAASKIGHPNIVNVTDSGTTGDGSFFFVMEFIEGIELGLALHRQGPFAFDRALLITDQMCQALQAAHDAGVIHRDLKPENVLLISREGRGDFVKVLDFGIAKSAEMEEAAKTGRRLTRPGVAMGTPEYMAPEQAAGKSADPRSDIYAVGSILYEMLTGDPPYDGENVMEVLHKKANQAPRPLRDMRPDVPANLVALVERAMARSPAQRPQTMVDFAREVAEIRASLVSGTAPGLEPVVTPAATPVIPPPLPPAVIPPTEFRRDTIMAGVLDPSLNFLAAGLPRRVAAAGAAVLVMLGAFVVVRNATSSPRKGVTATAVVALATPAPVRTPVPEPPKAIAMPPVIPPLVPTAVRAMEALPEGNLSDEAASRRGSLRGARIPATTVSSPQVGNRRLLDEGQRLLQSQRFAEARASFTKVAEARTSRPLSPDKAAAMVGLSRIAFQEKNYVEAARRAKQGVDAGAGVDARVLLGDAYFRLEKYPDAVAAYTEALRLNPDHASARKSLELARKRIN